MIDAELGITPELFIPPTAVGYRSRGFIKEIETNPTVAIELSRVGDKFTSPVIEIVLSELILSDEEKHPDIASLHPEDIRDAINAGSSTLMVLENLAESGNNARLEQRNNVEVILGSSESPSSTTNRRRSYLEQLNDKIRRAEERINEQLRIANQWLNILDNDSNPISPPNRLAPILTATAAGAAAMVPAGPGAIHEIYQTLHVPDSGDNGGYIQSVPYTDQTTGTERIINNDNLKVLFTIPPVPENLQSQDTPIEPTPTEAEPVAMDANVRRGPGLDREPWGLVGGLNLPDEVIVHGQVPDGNYYWYYFQLPDGRGAWMRSDFLRLVENPDGPVQLADFQDIFNTALAIRVLDASGNINDEISAADVIPLHVFRSFKNSTLAQGFPAETFEPGVLETFVHEPGQNYIVFRQTRDVRDANGRINKIGSLFIADIDDGNFAGGQFIPTGVINAALTNRGFGVLDEIGAIPGPNGFIILNSRAKLDVRMFLTTQSVEQSIVENPPASEVVQIAPTKVWAFPGLFEVEGINRDNFVPPHINGEFWQNNPNMVLNDGTEIPYGYLGEYNGHAIFAAHVANMEMFVGTGRTLYLLSIAMPTTDGGTNVVIVESGGQGGPNDAISRTVTLSSGAALLEWDGSRNTSAGLFVDSRRLSYSELGLLTATIDKGEDILIGFDLDSFRGVVEPVYLQALIDGQPIPGSDEEGNVYIFTPGDPMIISQ